MEDYFLSPMKKQASPLSSRATATLLEDDSPAEESGWTTYLEDFSRQRSENSFCSSFATSSLVSDARNHEFSGGFQQSTPPKKLSLIRKMRTKQKMVEEEEEEDTASSPVHSPKVNDFRRIDMNHMMIMKKGDGHGHSVAPLYGNYGDGAHYHEPGEEQRDVTALSGNNHEYTSLKKRGLCLVPLSLFSNYVG